MKNQESFEKHILPLASKEPIRLKAEPAGYKKAQTRGWLLVGAFTASFFLSAFFFSRYTNTGALYDLAGSILGVALAFFLLSATIKAASRVPQVIEKVIRPQFSQDVQLHIIREVWGFAEAQGRGSVIRVTDSSGEEIFHIQNWANPSQDLA